MGMPPTTAGAIDDMKKLKMGVTPRDRSSVSYVRAMLAGRKIVSDIIPLVFKSADLASFFPTCFCDGHMASHFRFTMGFARFAHIFGFQMASGWSLRTP